MGKTASKEMSTQSILIASFLAAMATTGLFGLVRAIASSNLVLLGGSVLLILLCIRLGIRVPSLNSEERERGSLMVIILWSAIHIASAGAFILVLR